MGAVKGRELIKRKLVIIIVGGFSTRVFLLEGGFCRKGIFCCSGDFYQNGIFIRMGFLSEWDFCCRKKIYYFPL